MKKYTDIQTLLSGLGSTIDYEFVRKVDGHTFCKE